MSNLDGTTGPLHITDTGRELRPAVCPRCEMGGAKVVRARGDSISPRCRFCGKRFRVPYDGRRESGGGHGR